MKKTLAAASFSHYLQLSPPLQVADLQIGIQNIGQMKKTSTEFPLLM